MMGDDKGNILTMEDCVDEDTKVKIEEAMVNLSCVKSESNDDALLFDDNLCVQCDKVPLEYGSVFTEPSYKSNLQEYKNNLVGFLDNIVMEKVVIKLDDIKKENVNFDRFHCSKCNGSYKGYCLKCSSLSHILNNADSIVKSESKLSTAPTDILEIRDTSVGKGVFLVESLPKNVTIGPFEGVPAVETTKGFSWTISDNKLVDIKNGNWMKDITCAVNASTKNLDIVQINGHLYFKTNREILEGEELLLYYDHEQVQKLDNSKECYFIPQEQDTVPKVFACTMCHLGFHLVQCLVEHKTKCPHEKPNESSKDLEFVECCSCKLWLEKQEHQEYHMTYCQEKCHRMRRHHIRSVESNEMNVEGIVDRKNGLGRRLNEDKTNIFVEDFQCLSGTNNKDSLADYINNEHTQNAIEKKYKCSECCFQTNIKYSLQIHLNRHKDIKPFECDACKMKFNHKYSYMIHMKNKHEENDLGKDYKCSDCSYQTNYKQNFNRHINTHTGIKPYECDICKMKFIRKSSLMMHIQSKHTGNNIGKDYKCSECSYQTNYKQNLSTHMNTHTCIKPYECDICKMTFSQKAHLKVHIKNKHKDNETGKDYSCLECSYQTNNKSYFNTHVNIHTGIKPHVCDICKMKFTQKHNLKIHIKNKHTARETVKDYKCSECPYQTNYKQNLNTHMIGHAGIKSYECDICLTKFTHKYNLKKHVKTKHIETEIGK